MFQSKTWVYTTKGMLDKISNLKRRILEIFLSYVPSDMNTINHHVCLWAQVYPYMRITKSSTEYKLMYFRATCTASFTMIQDVTNDAIWKQICILQYNSWAPNMMPFWDDRLCHKFIAPLNKFKPILGQLLQQPTLQFDKMQA